ncbi:Uncharacterised protein [Mycobacteroides abscessus subsp. abscessus]|nr:Uncharacterised protein [Mycobacteroides abscessus subsp. abscessus]
MNRLTSRSKLTWPWPDTSAVCTGRSRPLMSEARMSIRSVVPGAQSWSNSRRTDRTRV